MFKKILLAIDLDDPASRAHALPAAAALARCFSDPLTICTVVRDREAALAAEWSAIGYREMLDVARARLAELAADIPELAVETELGTGSVSNGILDIAARTGADLIVLASHAPGLKDYLLAANAERVMRHAPCSVLVVRPPTGEARGARTRRRGAR